MHQGPGLTNALTGITEAAKSRTPLLVLAADVAGAAVQSNFRIDVAAIAAAVGAVPARLHSAGFAVADAVRAYRTAPDERRTVLLAMPLDVQAGAVRPGRGAAGSAHLAAACSAAGAAGRRPGRARWPPPARPVFVAGRGRTGARPRAATWSNWPTPAARCWPPRPRPRACSAAARGIWTSAAGSPRRWPPS